MPTLKASSIATAIQLEVQEEIFNLPFHRARDFMTPNAQSSGRDGNPSPSGEPPNKVETTLLSGQIEAAGKIITLALKANWRGIFLRIVVDDGQRYTSVIIPTFAVGEFATCVAKVTKSSPKGQLEIEGRTIFVLMEEDGLLIGEVSVGRSAAVIVPSSGVEEFKNDLNEVARYIQAQSKPRLQENMLYSAAMQMEHKSIQLMLKENQRGRFVRIVERNGKHHTSIIVPDQHLEELRKMLDEAINTSHKTPAPDGSAP